MDRQNAKCAVMEMEGPSHKYKTFHGHHHKRENDYSVGGGGGKMGKKQDNQIQNITLCNMCFSKKVYYAVYNGVWGKAPRNWNFREFLH